MCYGNHRINEGCKTITEKSQNKYLPTVLEMCKLLPEQNFIFIPCFYQTSHHNILTLRFYCKYNMCLMLDKS